MSAEAMDMTHPVPEIFKKHEASQAAYISLYEVICRLPDVVVEQKKTCVHMATGAGAFLGVHPRKSGLRLTLALARSLPGDRIVKCEQVSSRRFYNDVDLLEATIDPELIEWITEAHSLKHTM